MRPSTERAALLGPAVVADALADALASGRPYRSELDALAGLGLDSHAVEGLAAQADTGLPTMAELRAGFEQAVASVDLRQPIPEGTGTLDRLVMSARSLVEVRPATPTEGADPAAVLSRIRAALDSGDLGTALTERSALPEELRTATAEWAAAAEARRAADELVARLRGEALSRLASEG
jgi:hypothetical protein